MYENARDSLTPGWAEYQDLKATLDPNNPAWVRGLSGLSLGMNALSGMALPNAGRLLTKVFGTAADVHLPRMPHAHSPVDRLPIGASKSVKEMGAELAEQAGRNRVSPDRSRPG